ncbi:hypothetical protein [Clostridium sp. VAP52]|uniref:hypothetical protein n=1 Tax=Clostridium sp. VAP52 TaxID=2949977 RepID=UPI00207A671A|nr:hypothetical protein [Clostridium sp. VAP52]
MLIKRLRCEKSRGVLQVKKVRLQNGGVNMVVCLNEYRNNNNNDPSIKISLVDMLFDREKRNTIYKYYDKKHTSTKEEDDICNDMMNYYAREKKDEEDSRCK